MKIFFDVMSCSDVIESDMFSHCVMEVGILMAVVFVVRHLSSLKVVILLPIGVLCGFLLADFRPCGVLSKFTFMYIYIYIFICSFSVSLSDGTSTESNEMLCGK